MYGCAKAAGHRLLDELRRRSPNDQRVFEAALAIIQEACPAAWRLHPPGRSPEGGPPAISLVQTSGPARINPVQPSGTPLVRMVRASSRQVAITDLDAISSEGLDQDTRWMIGTPIGVGIKTYGVLDTYGRALEPQPTPRRSVRSSATSWVSITIFRRRWTIFGKPDNGCRPPCVAKPRPWRISSTNSSARCLPQPAGPNVSFRVDASTAGPTRSSGQCADSVVRRAESQCLLACSPR